MPKIILKGTIWLVLRHFLTNTPKSLVRTLEFAPSQSLFDPDCDIYGIPPGFVILSPDHVPVLLEPLRGYKQNSYA